LKYKGVTDMMKGGRTSLQLADCYLRTPRNTSLQPIANNQIFFSIHFLDNNGESALDYSAMSKTEICGPGYSKRSNITTTIKKCIIQYLWVGVIFWIKGTLHPATYYRGGYQTMIHGRYQ